MKKRKREPGKKEAMKTAWANGVLAAAFLLGALCGYLVQKYVLGSNQGSLPIVETRPGGYEFINPLLECDMAQDTVEGNDLNLLKKKVRAFVDEKKKQRKFSHMSLYYRDLNNGPWIGVDEKATFSPASLLKVPFAMAILKEAETNPHILQKKLTYLDSVDYNLREHFKPSNTIERGKTYTVEQLIRSTVVYSDNNAYILLLRNIPQDKLIKVYTELGVDVPYDIKGEDLMTVKEYASFFRILFNASYLNREMSTKTLSYLSAADYKSGIVAGVPTSVRVVHKFGERSLGPKLETKQLHDCGIVYYPNHPYLLCVMTRGSSFESLNEIVTEVSQLFYRELDSQYKVKP